MKYWQEGLLDDLLLFFEPKEAVVGLLLFGSLSQPHFQPEEWSDIDILIIVRDGTLDSFFPAVDWLAHFGRLYTYSQSADDFTYTTRACFEDFRRMDAVITTETECSQIDRWSSVPFASGARVLFSRAKVVDELAGRVYPQKKFKAATDEQFLELVRNFRFKSMLAVYKIIRQDLLIALHLSQDLVRDCCVLAMMLRDRESGTNIHKQGGPWNRYVTQWGRIQQPFTSMGILDSIKASNEIFEQLAREWSPGYQERRQLLFDWMEKSKVKSGANPCMY